MSRTIIPLALAACSPFPSGGRAAPLATERKGSSCPHGWIMSGGACIRDHRERPLLSR